MSDNREDSEPFFGKSFAYEFQMAFERCIVPQEKGVRQDENSRIVSVLYG